MSLNKTLFDEKVSHVILIISGRMCTESITGTRIVDFLCAERIGISKWASR